MNYENHKIFFSSIKHFFYSNKKNTIDNISIQMIIIYLSYYLNKNKISWTLKGMNCYKIFSKLFSLEDGSQFGWMCFGEITDTLY